VQAGKVADEHVPKQAQPSLNRRPYKLKPKICKEFIKKIHLEELGPRGQQDAIEQFLE
jgi:hypothetical protein